MRINILTLFPEMFSGPFSESIVDRAQKKGLVEINTYNLRKWAKDKRGTVDDRPYGGGVGMVMMVTPIAEATEELKASSLAPSELRKDRQNSKLKTRVVLLSPRGKVWNQKMAQQYSKLKELTLICGHYEGVDERVRNFIDEEISVGDYVLTGGEIPAMVLVDSIVRLIPGVLEKSEATVYESFSPAVSDQGSVIRYQLPAISDQRLKRGMKTSTRQSPVFDHRSPITGHQPPITLEYPQFTRPEIFRGLRIPKILLSGDHKKISEWRQKEALKITKKVRPDLIKKR